MLYSNITTVHCTCGTVSLDEISEVRNEEVKEKSEGSGMRK